MEICSPKLSIKSFHDMKLCWTKKIWSACELGNFKNLHIPVTMPPTGLRDMNCWSCFALSSGVILHISVRSNSRGKCPKYARTTNPNVFTLFTHIEHDFCMYRNRTRTSKHHASTEIGEGRSYPKM